MSDLEFSALLARAGQGDHDALARLMTAHEGRLRQLAHSRLGPGLRRYVSTLDIVHSVQKSLLLGLRWQKFDIASPDKLVGLAVTILFRKIARVARQARRERELGQHLYEQHGGRIDVVPSAAGAIEENDAFAHLAKHLDKTERELVELIRQGHTTKSAADALGLDPDFARVKLWRAKKRLAASGRLRDQLL